MITTTIYPLQGIEIADVGPINLGQSRAIVEDLLGGPDSQDSEEERAVYSEYEFRIEYDANDQIAFIEFFSGPFPQRTCLSLYGIDPFTVGAEKLVQLLTEKNDGITNDSEGNFSYQFLNISVGIWRDSCEEDILEWIAKKKKDGEYDSDREMLEEELAKSRNFWMIGIGVPGYYAEAEEL